MLAVVYSTRDPAGSGIAKFVVDMLNLRKSCTCPGCVYCYEGEGVIVAGFDEDVVYFDFLDTALPGSVELYVVVSRHSSEAGVKSYTVHFTGNYGPEAAFGGRPRELGMSHPRVGWYLLNMLSKVAEERGRRVEYEVSYEATHHGPTSLSKPLVFVEIGSTLSEWVNPDNHAVVGTAVYDFLLNYPHIPDCISVIGIGGGHYPRKHTEVALTTNTCYGHIMPKYALQYLTVETLEMMYERTVVRPQKIIVEKKSTRLEHRRLIEDYARTLSIELQYI